MARPQSVALGGYFPTPRHLLPSLASLVGFRIPKSEGRHVLLDPCAGDGEAIAILRNLWFGETRTYRRYDTLNAHVIAVELEKQRFPAAKKRFTFWDESRNQPWDQVLEADAFHLGFNPIDGAS